MDPELVCSKLDVLVLSLLFSPLFGLQICHGMWSFEAIILASSKTGHCAICR